MKDETVAVAQGVRIATHPILRKLDEYIIERKGVSKDMLISVDNNIYRTAVICALGTSLLTNHDNRAIKKVEENGMKWIIDRTVISRHIRT